MASSKGEVVLLAVDGSAQAEHAFNWYAKHIHKPNNSVLVLHVTEPSQVKANVYHLSGDFHAETVEKTNTGTNVKEKYEGLISKYAMNGKLLHQSSSNPGEVIVDVAKENLTTVIVMGTRGMGMMRRTIMGSVSDYVLHHSHCPLFICRQ